MKPLKTKIDSIYDKIDARIRQIKKSSPSNYLIYSDIDVKLVVGDFMHVSDYKDQFKKDIQKKCNQD